MLLADADGHRPAAPLLIAIKRRTGFTANVICRGPASIDVAGTSGRSDGGTLPARHSNRSSGGELAASEWRRIYEHVVFYGLLVVFGVQSFIVSLIAACLFPLLPRRWGNPLGQFMIMAGFRQFLFLMKVCGILRCDLTALDALRGDRSLIIAANHPSLLDAVLIISRLPRVVCIMKAEIWNNWFLGGGARLAGYIRNDSARDMIRLSVASLSAPQQHLLIFPEGTRTVGNELNEFKSGLGLISRRAAASVQTVFIETNTRFLGKGWPLFKKPDFPLVYRITLGERRTAGDDVRTFVGDLQNYFRQQCRSVDTVTKEPGGE